jgi:hypothetical protein
MSDEKRIRLRIEPNGAIEIDSPVENYAEAVAGARELTQGLFVRSASALASAPADTARQNDSAPRERARVRPARSTSSSARAGRIGSFEPQRDLLTEEQEISLRQFAEAKKPMEQGDQVLVAMRQGEELLGRQAFSYNEIYTLLWRSGIDPLPKALDVVVQKLIQDQRIERGDQGYFLKFLGRSRVDKELPTSRKEVEP